MIWVMPRAYASYLVLEHYPAFIDYLRAVASIGSGFVLYMLVSTYLRRPSNMLMGAAIFSTLSMVGEAQQIGEPFIVYQLPARLIVIWFFWRAWVKKEHRTIGTVPENGPTTSASASHRTSDSDGSGRPGA